MREQQCRPTNRLPCAPGASKCACNQCPQDAPTKPVPADRSHTERPATSFGLCSNIFATTMLESQTASTDPHLARRECCTYPGLRLSFVTSHPLSNPLSTQSAQAASMRAETKLHETQLQRRGHLWMRSPLRRSAPGRSSGYCAPAPR